MSKTKAEKAEAKTGAKLEAQNSQSRASWRAGTIAGDHPHDPYPKARTEAEIIKAEQDDYRVNLEALKAANAKAMAVVVDKLQNEHDHTEAELEAKINPPKSAEELVFGEIEFAGHSHLDGMPMKGKITIPAFGYTEEGIFHAARGRNGNLSREGFSFKEVKPEKSPRGTKPDDPDVEQAPPTFRPAPTDKKH